MSNMSYCRFQNTSRDFADCVSVFHEAATDRSYNEEPEKLSEDEQDGAVRLLLRVGDLLALLQEATDADRLEDLRLALADPGTIREGVLPYLMGERD